MPHMCRVLLVTGLGVGCAAMASAQDRTFEHTMELQPGARLALEADRGSVVLQSWDSPTAEILARIEPPADVDADYAQRAVEGTAIEVRGNRRSVRIRTDYEGVPRRGLFRNRRLPRVHYEIRAPRQLDLDLEIDRSAATVEGFEGRLLLDLDRSDLDARDLAGTVTLTFDRGEFQASGLAGSIVIDLDRARGVVLDGVRGDLQLDAERTDVTLRDLAIENDSLVEMDRGDLAIELAADRGVTIDAALTGRSGFTVGPGDVSLPSPGVTGQHLFVLGAARWAQRSETESSGAERLEVNGGGPLLRIEADRGAVRLRTPGEAGGR